MSAFVVGTKTLNDVATLILKIRVGKITSGIEIQKMLYDTNVRSFNYRYSGRYADEVPSVGRFEISDAPQSQLIKSYFCWEYQSCENETDEAYRSITAEVEKYFSNSNIDVANVMRSSEYDLGYWGD